MAGYIERDEF
ncbi:hypothetical protein AVEN_129189-1, partial [Araneus ventricosus]